MDDLPGSSKRLRKSTIKEEMLTSDDLNKIMNWSSNEDVFSKSNWSWGNGDIGNSSVDDEENTESIVETCRSTYSKYTKWIWYLMHEEKYVAQLIPFTGKTGLLVSYPGNKSYEFFHFCANEKLFTFIVLWSGKTRATFLLYQQNKMELWWKILTKEILSTTP